MHRPDGSDENSGQRLDEGMRTIVNLRILARECARIDSDGSESIFLDLEQLDSRLERRRWDAERESRP